jgi:RNA polymerase sigma-70 factor (ECF subfamily)
MTDSLGQSDIPEGQAERLDLASAWTAHNRWLRTVLAARGVDRDALDDVMQLVWMSATRREAQLRDASRVGPWLYRIAVIEALQYRRRTGRRRRFVSRYAGDVATSREAVNHDPLAWLLAAETQQLVRKAIAQLSPQDAEILLLKYTEDWSYRELANRLGISESALEARLHRARGRMRGTLARLAPELIPSR